MKINLLTVKIAQAMGYDQKDIFQRLSKLLEEQGELLEAYDLQDFDETIEEAVDNLLVITSIAYVIDPTSIQLADNVVNAAFDSVQMDHSVSQKMLTTYMIATGKMSDAIQKNRKVAASSYKGNVTDVEAVNVVFNTLSVLARFLASQTKDVEKINALILKKNTKWLQKSLSGMGLSHDEIEIATQNLSPLAV